MQHMKKIEQDKKNIKRKTYNITHRSRRSFRRLFFCIKKAKKNSKTLFLKADSSFYL